MAIFVKPNPAQKVEGKAVQVFDPERGHFLPAEGDSVPENAYWTRRIADGDCLLVEQTAAELPQDGGEDAAETKPAAKKKGK